MARRKGLDSPLWSLQPADAVSASNARIARALVRCVRRFPGVFPHHSYDDLGAALAPAVEVHAALARRCIKAHRRVTPSDDVDAFEGRPAAADLRDQETLALLGEALAVSTPRFRGLFDKIAETLDEYVAAHPSPADANADMLSRLIGLSPAESALIRLAGTFCYGSIDRNLFSFVNTPARILQAVEAIFGVHGSECAKLLQGSSRLARAGLLGALALRHFDLEDLLKLTPAGEALLGTPHEDEQSMSRSVLLPMASPCSSEQLAWPHLRTEHSLLRAALQGALDASAAGINILLYGGPGTGKTEFVRQLLGDIGASGFSIAEADDDGDEATRGDRLASLQLSQTFAGHVNRAVLVLDEAEDIFQNNYNHPLAQIFGRTRESKGWMNALLEKNAHPVIWISNRVSQLDPAYLRRFTFCLEFPATPVAVRSRIARNRLTTVGCSETLIDSIAAIAEVTPAHIDAAARFASFTRHAGTSADAAVEAQIRSHLKAGGHADVRLRPSRLTRFDMRYLNVMGNATPERVLQSLTGAAIEVGGKAAAVALLFSGAPGTGKTQFAAELATRLGQRLVVRTASDINSKWYGESEGNVAKMFRDCDPRDELLFLDEAEVLLGAREGSESRADRAVTAEFLRWLEVFEGTFVCATNHAGSFDAALMRRFTFRMDFRPLNHRQRCEMYAELALGWQPEGEVPPVLDRCAEARLAGLDGLTPGDFANTARRIRTLALPAQCWLDELETEQAAKPGARTVRIGF